MAYLVELNPTLGQQVAELKRASLELRGSGSRCWLGAGWRFSGSPRSA
jgi:hypothetical protein